MILNPEMNFDPTIRLGPLVDPCNRLSDFGECMKGVGIFQDLLLLLIAIYLSYILVPLIKQKLVLKISVPVAILRFWSVSFFAVILTIVNQRMIPAFGQPYHIVKNSTYNSEIMEFPTIHHYETAFKTPFFVGYICIYMYDFLFLFIISSVNKIYTVSHRMLGNIFEIVHKVYIVAYFIIIFLCTLFSIRYFQELVGYKWLSVAYTMNFVIHPSVLLFFYIVCCCTFVFNQQADWLYPMSFKYLMQVSLFFIMFLILIQTSFSVFMFHMNPNPIALFAMKDYSKYRWNYQNIVLSYDFLVFIFPFIFLVLMMLTISKINIDIQNSKEDFSNTFEKSLIGEEHEIM